MPSLNKAMLIGHLGRDPELKYTEGGKAVAKFSIATSEKWKDKEGESSEKTVWHNIVAWGKQAEVINQYLSKGSPVYIEGRIENRSYDDKDGNKKYISEVVVQQFQFLGKKEGETKPAKAEDPDLPF